MRKKWMKVFVGMMAVVSLVAQTSVQVFASEGSLSLARGKTVAAGSTTQSNTDEWAGVTEAAGEENFDLGETDEFGCRLKSWHTCYKYEYAYRTGDTSGLSSDEEMAFYEGLKGYLDYAYQFDTPYEQEKAIHDHMVLHCQYALDHKIDGKLSNDVWNYDGVFVYGQAVCQGYALAFKLCMDILGIESRVILGRTPEGKHAWNAVQLDGEWYYVDVTWDDPVPDEEGRVIYNYFNVPQWWIEQEHEIKAPLEPVGTKYSADEVLTLTVGSEKKELNRMLTSHFWDLSPLALYRVYLVKEDGTAWTKEEISNYHLPINFLNRLAYNSRGWWDIENGSVYCLYFIGWGTPFEFVFEILIWNVVLAFPVVAICLIVRFVKKRRRKGKLSQTEHCVESAEEHS